MTTTTQLVTGVDFVPFSTQDIDTAMDFYGGKLGLPRSVHIPERNYAEFETGNLTLSVFDAEGFGLEHRRPRGRRHPAVRPPPEQRHHREEVEPLHGEPVLVVVAALLRPGRHSRSAA